jgi:hypothetical protein
MGIPDTLPSPPIRRVAIVCRPSLALHAPMGFIQHQIEDQVRVFGCILDSILDRMRPTGTVASPDLIVLKADDFFAEGQKLSLHRVLTS